MKKCVLILLLIVTVKITAQEQLNDSFNPFEETKFKIGGGVFIPQGNLKTYFAVSPLVEMNIEIPIKDKNKSIGIGGQIAIPNQKQSFEYIRIVDTLQVKSKMMGNIYLSLGKTLVKKNDSEFVLKLGLGASMITTDARNPYYSGKDDEKKYEIITAFLATPSIEYNKKFSNSVRLTFGTNFQYSPYKIEGAVKRDIGSFGVIPKLLITF